MSSAAINPENGENFTEAKFLELLNYLPGVICQLRPCSADLFRYSFVSVGSESLFEVSPSIAQQDPNTIHRLIHPDDRLELEQSFHQAARTLEAWRWQGRFHLPSGQLKWIEATFQPEQLPDQLLCWWGQFLDITHRRQVEQAFQQTQNALETAIQRVTELQGTVAQLQQAVQAGNVAFRKLEQAVAKRDRFFEISADLFCIAGFDGYFKQVNPAFTRVLGFTAKELYAQPFLDWVHPDDREATIREAANLSQGSVVVAFENRYRCKDGSYRWLSWISTPYPQEQSIYASVRDITEQKQIEAERRAIELSLQKEREFLNAMLDHLSDGIVACDENGKLTLFNRATREFHGLPETPLPPEQWATHFSLYRADGQTPLPVEEIPLFRAFNGELVRNAEMVIAPKQGKSRALLASGQAFFDQDGKKLGAVIAMHDITDRQQAQLALHKALQDEAAQSRLLRTVIDSTSDWIFAKDAEFRYILVNRSFAAAVGKAINKILGKDDLELNFTPELVWGNPEQGIRGFRTDDIAAIAGETIKNPFDSVVLADGSRRIFDTQKMPLYGADGKVFAVLGISRDMTERKQAEDALRHSETQLREKAKQLEQALHELQRTQAQLVQTEKMSSLGQLVAGVAHEINNPVNFIYGNLTHADEYTRDLLKLLLLYQQCYPNPAPEIQIEAEAIDLEFLIQDLPKLMDSMRVGANRIQKIVASLRNFSRMDEAEMKVVDIHEGIDSTLMILQNRLKARSNYPDIEIVKHYGNLPLVECYPGQLNQVFMNILSNAIDALEEGLERNPTFQPQIKIYTQLTAQEQVQIRIVDNGMGIPAHIQKRIFEPFFTTKPVGKGTGLGMSISYQIITERHGGSLFCQAEAGKQTEFTIEIPIWQQERKARIEASCG